MHELYELKEKLMKELEEYGRKDELTAGSLEVVDKLTHTIKNLCKIIEESDGYSEAGGGSYARSYEGRGRSYENSNRSYARGRGRNARRDSMGRYSGDYSYAGDELADQLREMMEDAPEQVKADIRKLITKVESM